MSIRVIVYKLESIKLAFGWGIAAREVAARSFNICLQILYSINTIKCTRGTQIRGFDCFVGESLIMAVETFRGKRLWNTSVMSHFQPLYYH